MVKKSRKKKSLEDRLLKNSTVLFSYFRGLNRLSVGLFGLGGQDLAGKWAGNSPLH